LIPRGRRYHVLPGVLNLYLLRGLAGPFLLAFLLITMAMMLERALRLAHELAASGAHLGFFVPMLVQFLPYYVSLALPVAFLIALIVMLSNLDEATELEAMLASGLSLGRIALPLMVAGVAVAAATLVANGYWEPYGRYQFRMLKARALEEARISDLKPLAFYQPVPGMTLTFEQSGDRVARLFLHRTGPTGSEQLLTARYGTLLRPLRGTQLQIELEDGVSYEDGNPAARGGRLAVAFSRYRLREPLRAAGVRPRGNDQKELVLDELAEEAWTSSRQFSPAAVGVELHSRLARSFSVLLLPLLAVPLCLSAKKMGRGLGIACAGAVLILYHHGVNFTKKLALDGDPSPAAAFILLEGALAALVLWIFFASRHLPSHGPLTPLLRRLGSGGEPVVGRSENRARLRGRTVSAYAAGSLAAWIVTCTAALTLIFQMVDIVEHGDDFIERDFGAWDIARYAALRFPALVQQTLPLATLAGSMLAFLRLTRFNEMVAIRGMGISLRRMSLMFIPVVACVGVTAFALAEWVTPNAESELAAWWRKTDPRPASDARWFRIGSDIASVQSTSADGRELRGLTIYRRDSGGLLVARLSAKRAWAAKGGWRMLEVEAMRRTGNGTEHSSRREIFWPVGLGPKEARALFAPSAHISASTARRSLRGEVPVSEGPERFQTRLQRMIAEPLAPLVMMILALPLLLGSSRTGPSWPLLLYPITAGAAFMVCDGILAAAAATGQSLPWMGAWAAPLLFGLLGATVALYADE
jgi:lipopolysaccharide export system permease protein